MKKILVVEDDEFLSDSYKDKLSNNEIQVSVARDGQEAIAQADSFKPDLIILDLVIPKINGVDVLKKLKANPKTKNIKVLIASNIDQREVVKETLALGAESYFIKSNISLADLYATCLKYLK